MAIDPNTVINPKNLLAAFAGTRALKANDAAYQTIVKLINLIGENQTNITNNILNDQTAIIEINITIGNLKNADYVTWTNELGILPNSRQVLAGTNITLDTSIPGQITINSTGSSGTVQTSSPIWIRDNEFDEGFVIPGPAGPIGATGATGPAGASGSSVIVPGQDGQDGFDGSFKPDKITYRSLSFTIDNGGIVIGTGVGADGFIDFDCTIISNTVIADQSGSVVLDVWVKNSITAIPTVADTITASALPTLSSASGAQDTTLTGWSTTIKANSRVRINVNSATTVTRVQLTLTVRVT